MKFLSLFALGLLLGTGCAAADAAKARHFDNLAVVGAPPPDGSEVMRPPKRGLRLAVASRITLIQL